MTAEKTCATKRMLRPLRKDEREVEGCEEDTLPYNPSKLATPAVVPFENVHQGLKYLGFGI